jgi:hypothetical protein
MYVSVIVLFMFSCIAISNLSCCIKANAVTVDLMCVLLVAYLVIRTIGIVVYTTSELGTSSIAVNTLRLSHIALGIYLLDSDFWQTYLLVI